MWGRIPSTPAWKREEGRSRGPTRRTSRPAGRSFSGFPPRRWTRRSSSRSGPTATSPFGRARSAETRFSRAAGPGPSRASGRRARESPSRSGPRSPGENRRRSFRSATGSCASEERARRPTRRRCSWRSAPPTGASWSDPLWFCPRATRSSRPVSRPRDRACSSRTRPKASPWCPWSSRSPVESPPGKGRRSAPPEEAKEESDAETPRAVQEQRADDEVRFPASPDGLALHREDDEERDERRKDRPEDDGQEPVLRARGAADHQPQRDSPHAAPERERDHGGNSHRGRRRHHPRGARGHLESMEKRERSLMEDERREEAG